MKRVLIWTLLAMSYASLAALPVLCNRTMLPV
jgi:hypothetical protein